MSLAMTDDFVTIAIHLVSAIIAGGVIGLERSYHGRPAGFRTHTLVCLASSLLMLVTMYQWHWLPAGTSMDTVRTDPTRMAQGIMTGIGFLGAGVIFKEGLSVRGLTTSASIWMTAAIGILMGIGFYMPAIMATVLTLGTLSVFRWFENQLPSHYYAHLLVSFDRNNVLPEDELKAFLQNNGFSAVDVSYRTSEDSTAFEYKVVICTNASKNLAGLAVALRQLDMVRNFSVSPTGS